MCRRFDVTHNPWTIGPHAFTPLLVNLTQYFGRAVRQHRELMRLSQEDLADRAGLDRTYVSGIERGRRNPTLEVLQRLSDALGADLDVIFAAARDLAAKDKARKD